MNLISLNFALIEKKDIFTKSQVKQNNLEFSVSYPFSRKEKDNKGGHRIGGYVLTPACLSHLGMTRSRKL